MSARLSIQKVIDLVFQDEQADSDLEKVSEQGKNKEKTLIKAPQMKMTLRERIRQQGRHLCPRITESVGHYFHIRL